MTTAVSVAETYAEWLLADIPRALTLCDRDPTSPTFGCFDRNFWHYRTQDFPSGMYQELALPLAAVSALARPGNRWRGEPRIRDIAVAAVRYAARSAHPDGSCDDYYPFERTLGATAFAAAACTEALRLVGERDPELLDFTRRRARWLAATHESGRLSNHQALVALALARAAALTGDAALLDAARRRVEVCLSWQHPEGWFQEYEGADPGYQTLTIAFLAALSERVGTPDLDRALERALGFAAHFLHPDGSYGGEYGSRNTCLFLPSGVERLAGRVPQARYLADGWLRGAVEGRRGYAADDRLFSHLLADLPAAYAARRARNEHAETSESVTQSGGRGAPRPSRGAPSAGGLGGFDSPPMTWTPAQGITEFPAARLCVVRAGAITLVVATGKGGVFRAYHGTRLLRNDAGLVAIAEDGARYVTHITDVESRGGLEEGGLVVRARFHRSRRALPTPAKQVAFRVLNATAGRLAPQLVRRALQRVLITGKRPVGLALERRIAWTGDQLSVQDRIVAGTGAPRPARLYAATDATSIYVAASDLWQEASLEPWEDLSPALRTLEETGACEITRKYP